MNQLTKIAIIISLIGLSLLLFVIASGAAYPDFFVSLWYWGWYIIFVCGISLVYIWVDDRFQESNTA